MYWRCKGRLVTDRQRLDGGQVWCKLPVHWHASSVISSRSLSGLYVGAALKVDQKCVQCNTMLHTPNTSRCVLNQVCSAVSCPTDQIESEPPVVAGDTFWCQVWTQMDLLMIWIHQGNGLSVAFVWHAAISYTHSRIHAKPHTHSHKCTFVQTHLSSSFTFCWLGVYSHDQS